MFRLDSIRSWFLIRSMNGGRSRAKATDDRTFAVRLRFRIPERGMSYQWPELDAWLRRNAPGAYVIHPAGTYPDASYLYMNNPDLAAECSRLFALEIDAKPKETP